MCRASPKYRYVETPAGGGRSRPAPGTPLQSSGWVPKNSRTPGVRFTAISPIAEKAASRAIQFDVGETRLGRAALESAGPLVECPASLECRGGAVLGEVGACACCVQKAEFEFERIMWTDYAFADMFGELSSGGVLTPTIERR